MDLDIFEKTKSLEIFNIFSFLSLVVYSIVLVYTVYINLIFSIKTEKIDLFFPCIFLSFLELVLSLYNTGIQNNYAEYAEFSSRFHLFYISFETITIAIFYVSIANQSKMDSKIWLLLFCILIILIFFVIFEVTSFYISLVLFEFFIINICSISIYILAIKNEDFKLRPDKFYINNGLFLFINFTVPYFIIDESNQSNLMILKALKSINSIGYCIMFISNILSKKWNIKNLQQS